MLRTCSGSSRVRCQQAERRHNQTATASDGCRAAAACVPCGTTATLLVAKRPERLPRCSGEARHSTERLSSRAGSGWTRSGSSGARRDRRRSSRATALMLTATVSGRYRAAAACMSCGTTASLQVVKRQLVQAQDGHAAAAARHVVSDGAQAGRRLSCRRLR